MGLATILVVLLITPYITVTTNNDEFKCRAEGSTILCQSLNLTDSNLGMVWPFVKSINVTAKLVDISYNNLTTITRLHAMPIEALDASHNTIKIVGADAFICLFILTRVDLSWNKLTVDGLFQPISPTNNSHFYTKACDSPNENLRVLNLAANRIQKLPRDAFKTMPNLTTLDLSRNALKFMDEDSCTALSSLRFLEELSLQLNGLIELNGKLFENLSHLRLLDLAGNILNSLPAELSVPSLKTLILDDNYFREINSSTLPRMSNLNALSLNHMPFLQVVKDGAFGRLQALKNLSIICCPFFANFSSKAFYKYSGSRLEANTDIRLENLEVPGFILDKNFSILNKYIKINQTNASICNPSELSVYKELSSTSENNSLCCYLCLTLSFSVFILQIVFCICMKFYSTKFQDIISEITNKFNYWRYNRVSQQAAQLN